jgi:4'-phosphopantetheinyl transferase
VSELLAPGAGEVVVWWAELPDGGLGAAGELGDPGDPATAGALARHLDERTRARLRRMLRREDRDRGVLAHSLARRALAAVVGGEPQDVPLDVACAGCGSREHGKPHVRDGVPDAPEFNLTHSGRVVAVALAPPGLPVGVDVEARRTMDWAPLRRNVFGDAEWHATEAAPDPDGERFTTWARKEAAVKASGHGLSLGLSGVTTHKGPKGWFAALPEGVGNVTGWDLDTTAGHVGAVGVLLGRLPGDAVPQPVVRRVPVSLRTA